MNNNIRKTANKFYKKTKGNVNLKSIISQLRMLGYSTVFFNTPEGDEILSALSIFPQQVKAFTYCGSANIVFVDNNQHPADKLYSLLHELGHILIGHIGKGEIDLNNKRKIENEAEAFAYMVLNPPKRQKSLILFMLAAIILSIFLGAISAPVIAPVTKAERADYVYVTSSGTKYHDINCIHVKDKNCAELPQDEALKIFQPCKVCNP